MEQRLFGTDGIRGRVNAGAITPQNLVRLGEAIGFVLRSQGDSKPRILIGRDTRNSGVMIEAAIIAGLVNAGADATNCGILPTPAIGFLTRKHEYDMGLMITASHNPATDNGIKLFGRDGFKISEELQITLEQCIHSDDPCHVAFDELGTTTSSPSMAEEYVSFAQNSVGQGVSFRGLKVCLDCANGAGTHVGPLVFESLGAEVSVIGNLPNGSNINADCGALHTKHLQNAVLNTKSDIGFALDGDADRLIVVDETGAEIDGDQIMGALGLHFAAKGMLKGKAVAATIMSNLGLEHALRQRGISLERTKVGDRHVVERMREKQINIGGEQSGHIVLTDFVTTGDALIAALQLLAIVKDRGEPASKVLSVFDPVPQILENVHYGTTDPLVDPSVKDALAKAETELGETGRLVIRKSGTEPVIRVMVEALDQSVAEKVVRQIVAKLEATIRADGSE